MRRFLSVLGLLVLLAPGSALAYTSPGSPDGYVTDFADILSDETESKLELELAQYEASTTIEIAVATVNSLDGDDVAVYANELFREWGIGQADTNNGLLVLVAPNEREMRIEVGYGLEGAVPDITAGQIVDDIMTPQFKLGNYDAGVLEGVQTLVRVSGGEEFVSPVREYDSSDPLADFFGFGTFGIVGLVFLFQFVMMLGAIFSRSNSWWFGGIVGIMISLFLFFFTGSQIVGVLGVFILGPLGALFDYLVSKKYKWHVEHGLTPPWYIGGGGFSGGGSSSGGGGGGSFGGGSSGGGGASGSW